MKYKNIQDLQQFKEDYNLLTIKEITNKYSIGESTLWRYTKSLGITRKVGSKKLYSVNDNYFSSENECSNKYYILGLIYTDGNLPIKNKNSFIISNIDKQLLENIAIEMGYNGKIVTEYHKKFNKYIYKLQITSEKIRKDLESFNLKPNKTMDLKFPSIPMEYMRDFARGLWDGDGCVITPLSRQKTIKLLSSNFVCASKEFIENFLNILPVKKKIVETRIKNRINPQYVINFRGFDSLKLKEFFYYENCLCMKRKKDLFFSYKPRRSENTIG